MRRYKPTAPTPGDTMVIARHPILSIDRVWIEGKEFPVRLLAYDPVAQEQRIEFLPEEKGGAE